jgi:hypothetical protein
LISEHEVKRSYVFSEDYYAILPELTINKDYRYLTDKQKVTFDSFSSKHAVKDAKYLRNLLSKGGFLV